MAKTKKELIDEVSSDTGLPKKDVNIAVNHFLELIKESICDGSSVLLTGFGSFHVRTRRSRIGYNPKTREPIQIGPAGAFERKPTVLNPVAPS